MTDPINDPYKTFGDPTDEPAAILESGTVLAGKYRLVEQIGRGGMGVVWSAEDTVADRKIVLKFVPSELKNFEAAVAQLKESFKKVHELQHQHICPVYTLEEDYSLGYYHTMKWLDGETLDEYVIRAVGRENPLPPEETLRILRPVAEALDYAHGKRIIHRDIKPSNIFVVLDGEKKIKDVQVIDFGLASEIRSTLTRVSQMRFDNSGTRPYMAPEQWRARRQTGQTDQYALAVVAYELLAGYLPFESDDLEALRLAVLQDPPDNIRELPDSINTALRKALAKDAGERFDNCTAFLRSMVGMDIADTDKSVLPPIPERNPRVQPPVAAGVESLMKRGRLFQEDADWKQANEYFDRVLDIDPEYAPAYVGKLCVELQVQYEEALGDGDKPISGNKHYQKAVRFAGGDYKAKLEEYDEKICERPRLRQYERLIQEIENVSTEDECIAVAKQLRDMDGYRDTAELAVICDDKFRKLKDYREEQKRILEQRYELLCAEIGTATTEEDWRSLAASFRAMNGYKNTTELATQCDDKCRKLKEYREEQSRILEQRYKLLCKEIETATTEEDWRGLATRVQAMNGYKNTAELAIQCDGKYRKIKESREEHERVERILRVYLETKSLKLQHI